MSTEDTPRKFSLYSSSVMNRSPARAVPSSEAWWSLWRYFVQLRIAGKTHPFLEEDTVELSMDEGNRFVEETQSPESAAAWKQQLDEFAPGASDWVVGAVFGGTYQREGLELRDRQMLNMAALAAMGGTEPQLTGHIKTAVDVAGMSKEDVAECFVHLMPYIGVPKTLAAMRCMKAAFDG